MSNSNTSPNPASSGDAPEPLPVASFTRAAIAERQANPTPRVEADAETATNPPTAGDASSTGIEQQSLVVANDHDDSESESSDSSESSTDEEEFAPAADDAAESRARTDAALAAFNTEQQAPPNHHAAAQFAARGIHLLGPSQGSFATGPPSIHGESGQTQHRVSRGQQAPLPRPFMPPFCSYSHDSKLTSLPSRVTVKCAISSS